MKQTVSRVIKSENYNVQLPVVLLEVTNPTGCLELFVKNKLNFMFNSFQHVTMVFIKEKTTNLKLDGIINQNSNNVLQHIEKHIPYITITK